MNGGVAAPIQKSLLQFLHEQALAPGIGKWSVKDPVSLCCLRDDLGRQRRQAVTHDFGLRQRQRRRPTRKRKRAGGKHVGQHRH